MTHPMEYSRDGGLTWTSVPNGQTEVTDLEPGDYQVRVKETADTMQCPPAS